MTAPTWADRSLPLADSVRDAILAAMKANRWTPSDEDAFWATTDELLADIAAADRLARAALAYEDAYIAYSAAFDSRASVDDPRNYAWDAAGDERDAALAAYRARMAQGVSGG